jgi:hypothetical protein
MEQEVAFGCQSKLISIEKIGRVFVIFKDHLITV